MKGLIVLLLLASTACTRPQQEPELILEIAGQNFRQCVSVTAMARNGGGSVVLPSGDSEIILLFGVGETEHCKPWPVTILESGGEDCLSDEGQDCVSNAERPEEGK
jgi:hypothetical protein